MVSPRFNMGNKFTDVLFQRMTPSRCSSVEERLWVTKALCGVSVCLEIIYSVDLQINL